MKKEVIPTTYVIPEGSIFGQCAVKNCISIQRKYYTAVY